MKKKVIIAKDAPAAVGSYSHACKFGNLVFSCGTLGLDPVSGNLPEGVEAQAHLCFKNLEAALKAGGSCLDNCVKVTVYVKNMSDFAKVNEIYKQYIKEPFPARTCIEAAALPKGALVEIEAVAHT